MIVNRRPCVKSRSAQASRTAGAPAARAAQGRCRAAAHRRDAACTNAPASVGPASTRSRSLTAAPQGAQEPRERRVRSVEALDARAMLLERALRCEDRRSTVNIRASPGLCEHARLGPGCASDCPGSRAAAGAASSLRARQDADHPRARCRCRSESRSCARAIAAHPRALTSPVIHWLAPSASAVRPSRLIASLIRTQGRWRCMRLKKPMLSSSRLLCEQSRLDGDARRAQPRGTCARDARVRIFNLRTPRARDAPRRAHRRMAACGRNGCRARASHRRWRPAAAAPAALSAMASACASPGALVPALGDDLAVAGDDAADAWVGLGRRKPRAASSSARAIAIRSNALKSAGTLAYLRRRGRGSDGSSGSWSASFSRVVSRGRR